METMNKEYRIKALADAEANRDVARAVFEACKPGTRKWREAEEDLNFWQGKVAFLMAE